jgi:Tfp pilus assembly protein PilO
MTSITVKKEEPPSDFVCLEDEAADMERLKQENEALRRALAGLKKQLTVQNKSDSVEDVKESKAATAENLKSLHASLSTPEGTNEFYSQLRVGLHSFVALPAFALVFVVNRFVQSLLFF